jgi:hypothetical protein
MDKELIERLAREAGSELWRVCLTDRAPVIPDLVRFASLVAEECAKVCDGAAQDPSLGAAGREGEAEHAARVIRAKFLVEVPWAL